MGVTAALVRQAPLSHNLVGQKLGKKGRGTRERILSATERLLYESADATISLSAVAREASLGMTTLYLYFGDLTELLLAVLGPIMASAEESYVADLRPRWPDEELHAHCARFVQSYAAFWRKHTRVLHLRNSLADANDSRMRDHRIHASHPVMQLLAFQMDTDPAAPRSTAMGMATVLLTGVERLITIITDASFSTLPVPDPAAHLRNLLGAEARLLELGIRDARSPR